MIWIEALKLTYKRNKETLDIMILIIMGVLFPIIPTAELFLGKPESNASGIWIVVMLINLMFNFIILYILYGGYTLLRNFYKFIKEIYKEYTTILADLKRNKQKETLKDVNDC